MVSAIVLSISPTGLLAFEKSDSSNIPHVSNKAKESFLQYQYAGEHKAFAIAPGGAWYWLTEAVSEEQAEKQSLEKCQKNTQQKCVLYALNNQIVFDAKRWPKLWGPYADSTTASKASQGIKVGQRFPDLSWSDKHNRKTSIARQNGKITFLHFWGSWCPPCLREFPSLKKLHQRILNDHPNDIEMVMLQLREPFSDSMKWVNRYGFSDMPVYDSGVRDSETTMLLLDDGSEVKDRNIARVFPSTYVLDRNGLVIFSHHGPVRNWLDYIEFLNHAVKFTEKPND